jgi:peroxiredoxin Q/BCP
VTILGVSPDSPEKQKRFRDKHGFPYRLLSDPDHVLAEAYGAWVKKIVYDRETYGIERTTILVDEKGVVREIWRKVKVDGHVDAVLLAAKGLA